MTIKPQLLRRCRAFAELPAADVDRLAELASMMWVDRSDYLCRQGDPADHVFAIFDGAVKLSRVTSSGRVMVMDFLGAGELIGARALLGDGACPDDARAVEDALVATIPAVVVEPLLHMHPELIVALAGHLAQRLELQERKVAALSTTRVHQRLARGLLRLGETLAVRHDGQFVVNARLTQAEIAEWIGTTRETASTLLNELRRAGFIDIVARRVHLLDIEALSAYSELEEPPSDLVAFVEHNGSNRAAGLASSPA